MCDILEINRSGYYKYKEPDASKDEYTELTVKIFNENQKACGTCRIKQECRSQGVILPRRRIARMMCNQALVAIYIVAKHKYYETRFNDDVVPILMDRKYNER